MSQKRVPAGVREGGEFATSRIAESSVTLGNPQKAESGNHQEGLQRRWERTLDAVVAFTDEHGRPPRQPKENVPDEEGRLGSWLNTQRQSARRGNMTAEREAILNERLPGWGPGAARMPWTEWLNQVAAFTREHGRPPRQPGPPVSADEGILGNWLTAQRRAARAGSLASDRRDALEASVPHWADPDGPALQATWREQLSGLAAFVRKHKRLPRHMGTNLVTGELELGSWLHVQRHALRTGNLAEDRQRQLAERVPSWRDSDVHEQWNRALERVLAIKTSTGDLPATSTPAGKWITRQRTAARKGALADERRKALDAAIPGWFG